MDETLEARIGRLEAIEEIRALKARYAEVCDTGYDPDRMRPLFAADAFWDGGERFGRYEGVDAICGFFADVSSQITWALHYMVAPVVEVSDDLRDGVGELVPARAVHDRDRRRTAGDADHGALRGQLPARAGRLEDLRAQPRLPDDQPARGRLGQQAVLERMIPRIRPEELHELAASWGFTIDEEEEAELLVVAEGVFQAFDALEAQESARIEPVAAVRAAGRPPEADEDPLNAIVRFCRVRAEGAEGILSGKRIGIKDSVAIAGIPLTCGSRILEGYVPAEDSVVVDRILRAGGEVVAITNMDDMALSGGGESSWYGPTLNPWDETRSAGGSSSGSAAALFYDGIDVCVGGDQGGSIRVPASWCGVVGLKPTHGLVPYTGIAGMDHTFDHCGPMGRSAADVALLLKTIAGKHESDPRQRDVVTEDYVAAVEHAPDDLRGSGSASSPRASRTVSVQSRRRSRRCAPPSSGCEVSARSPSSSRCPSTCRPADLPSPVSSRE